MTSPWQSVLDDLLAAYNVGRHLILLFDYDGTLVPIAEHPRLARLDRSGRRLLEKLAARPRVHVGILSGRQLDELKEMLCLANLCLAGTSGMELELFEMRLVHPRARQARVFIEEIARRVAIQLGAFPGAWLEDKGLGFTVHYRHTRPRLIGRLRAQVRETLKPFSSGLRSTDGPMALEVTPELGWNKGTAVSKIVRHLRPCSYTLLYAGDSANDADGMMTTIALGGAAIGVGPDAPPVAQFSLPDPAALQELLVVLERSLSTVTKPADLTPACRRQEIA
jgi:trehalose 6-phosphate phosphatase